MSILSVSRPIGARVLRRAMHYLPLDGGYAMELHVGDKRFKTPIINGVCNEGPDKAILQLYSRILPHRQGCFLDVGANVGQTLLAVRAVRPQMPYVGYEPNVACVAYMRALMQINDIQSATVLPIALMDHSGLMELQLFHDHEADPTASLIVGVRPEESVSRTVYVPSYTWEQTATVFKDQTVGFVKIDVEGAELEVLCTIEPLLRAQQPWMLVEILPTYSTEYSNRLRRQIEIESLLANHGYVLLRVKKNADSDLSHLQHIRTMGIHDKLEDCDYLVVPAEALDHITDLGLRLDTAE